MILLLVTCYRKKFRAAFLREVALVRSLEEHSAAVEACTAPPCWIGLAKNPVSGEWQWPDGPRAGRDTGRRANRAEDAWGSSGCD